MCKTNKYESDSTLNDAPANTFRGKEPKKPNKNVVEPLFWTMSTQQQPERREKHGVEKSPTEDTQAFRDHKYVDRTSPQNCI